MSDENSKITEIPLKSWEAFEEKIEEEHQEYKKIKKELDDNQQHGKIFKLLFRGQRNACWALETTLDRYLKNNNLGKKYSWKDYYNILERVLPIIESRTAYRYELSEFQYPQSPPNTPTPPIGHEMMIHLRHHEFPSPLLDWTRSHYIAAYFAFRSVSDCPSVAIFSFREFAGKGKISPNGPYFISTIGHYLKTHERHYLQQAKYTYCFKKEDNSEERIYWSHEDAEFGREQDILKKYIIPSTERTKVLEKLDLMNINAFSLFGNEESLMDTLAYQEIEKRKRR